MLAVKYRDSGGDDLEKGGVGKKKGLYVEIEALSFQSEGRRSGEDGEGQWGAGQL